MTPMQRNYSFRLPVARVRDWHPEGRAVSHLFNALSLLFPEGERFFIRSVRNFREAVSDKELQAAIKGFIGQEAMHGREHENYNEILKRAGLPALELESFVQWVLHVIGQQLPAPCQLSATIALEHFTAILADNLLANPRMLKGSEQEFQRLWLWHALEETEHKSVAYDVWRATQGTGLGEYTLRAGGMVLTTLAFAILAGTYTIIVIEKDRLATAGTRREDYRALLSFLGGTQGLLRQGIRPWLDYFQPKFHPWQHDNRHLLRRLKEFATFPRSEKNELAQSA